MPHPIAPIRRPQPDAPDTTMLGILLMATGFACYSVSDATAKFLSGSLPPLEIVWFRSLGLTTVALWLLARSGRRILRTNKPKLQIMRGIVAGLSSTAFIYAVSKVPLADAVSVSFIAPFIVAILGAFILGEKVGIRRILAITVGFIGMLIIVRPGLGVFQPAMLLVVAAATLFAIRQIVSRSIGRADPTKTTIVYTAFGSTLLITIPVMLVWQTPATGTEWLLLALVAAAAGAGEVFVIRALELAAAVALAPLQYTLIVWGTLLGWLVFDELPDRWTLVGGLIIVASGIYTINRERIAARRAAGQA